MQNLILNALMLLVKGTVTMRRCAERLLSTTRANLRAPDLFENSLAERPTTPQVGYTAAEGQKWVFAAV